MVLMKKYRNNQTMVQRKVATFALYQAHPFENEYLENIPINFRDVFVIFNKKTKHDLLAISI